MKSKEIIKDHLGRTLLGPLNELGNELTELTTTIGSFVINGIRDKFQRSITFNIGKNHADYWMEEALYGILYRYNNLKKKGNLALNNISRDGSTLHYRLGNGHHNLKYRQYNIVLIIQSSVVTVTSGRNIRCTDYTVLTYNLDPNFVLYFEKDMIAHRNSLLKIKKDSPMINVFTDSHDPDGYTYWIKEAPIYKRSLGTIYLPREQKGLLIDTINRFFANREVYKKNGIAWNLKIILHSEPGLGKDSLIKAIATEWNRSIYYISGGKNGKFIPNAITSHEETLKSPVFVISDIDKYPFLIDDTVIDLENKDENIPFKMDYKQSFGQMINALDGVLSGDDRIIIMTTNHIEKFSKVFLRNGRINLIMKLDYVNSEVFRKYVYDIYGEILPKNIKLKSKTLSIADLQYDILFLQMSFEDFISKHCT